MLPCVWETCFLTVLPKSLPFTWILPAQLFSQLLQLHHHQHALYLYLCIRKRPDASTRKLSSLCLSQRDCVSPKVDLNCFFPSSLLSFNVLPRCGQDILICLCSCVRSKFCDWKPQKIAGEYTGIARTHKVHHVSFYLLCWCIPFHPQLHLSSFFSFPTSFRYLRTCSSIVRVTKTLSYPCVFFSISPTRLAFG